MARPVTSFTCQDCGATHKKWAGRCDACGAWNTIVEEAPLSGGLFAIDVDIAGQPTVEVKT